jgi:biotin synthase
LKEAGVHAYNHNINTSKAHYEKICGTHGYDDRLDTMQKASDQGLSPCSGILVGMGETHDDIVDMAMTLRGKAACSIPVNFLVSIDKTPLQNTHKLTPEKCLRVLALMRFMNPSVELRIAGGRELNLRSLQPLGLMIANSIFIGDYLTTLGQSPTADLEMIRDLGYTVLGQPDDFLDKILTKPAPELKTLEHALR